MKAPAALRAGQPPPHVPSARYTAHHQEAIEWSHIGPWRVPLGRASARYIRLRLVSSDRRDAGAELYKSLRAHCTLRDAEATAGAVVHSRHKGLYSTSTVTVTYSPVGRRCAFFSGRAQSPMRTWEASHFNRRTDCFGNGTEQDRVITSSTPLTSQFPHEIRRSTEISFPWSAALCKGKSLTEPGGMQLRQRPDNPLTQRSS